MRNITTGRFLLAALAMTASACAQASQDGAEAAEGSATSPEPVDEAAAVEAYLKQCIPFLTDYIKDVEPTEEAPLILSYAASFAGDPMKFMGDGVEGVEVRVVEMGQPFVAGDLGQRMRFVESGVAEVVVWPDRTGYVHSTGKITTKQAAIENIEMLCGLRARGVSITNIRHQTLLYDSTVDEAE